MRLNFATRLRTRPGPCRWPWPPLRRLHRDQRGTISIVTLLMLLVFTMLLVMITNVARHADDKIKLQNAADAAGISSGVILTRGLNGLAHTNHLLCEIFAITAYLREGRDRGAEEMVPSILEAWELSGGDLQQTDFVPYPPNPAGTGFRDLGRAIVRRVPLEQEAVTAFGEEQAAAAEHFLPIFEYILEEELIPRFQRSLVQTVPALAVETAQEVVQRHGRPTNVARPDRQAARGFTRSARAGDRPLAVLWRWNILAVGQASEQHPLLRTLPAIDPAPGGDDYGSAGHQQEYFDAAIRQRRDLANAYLDLWNSQRLELFDSEARLSRFGGLWRIATRGQLDRLMNEDYPLRNIPFQIRRMRDGRHPREMRKMLPGQWRAVNTHLDHNYHLMVVVHRRHLDEMGPGLFRNPLARNADAQAFAQLQIYLPRPRYVRHNGQWGHWVPQPPDQYGNPRPDRFVEYRDNWPTDWDLLSQNWTTRLMPVALPNAQGILAQRPPATNNSAANTAANFRPARFDQLSETAFRELVTH